jgi:hypothetical protein
MIGSVRFYNLETEETELNPNWKKPEKKPSQIGKNKPNREKLSQTKNIEQNRVEPVFVLKNQTEPKPVGFNRFRFFLKKFNLVVFFFFIKTKPN